VLDEPTRPQGRQTLRPRKLSKLPPLVDDEKRMNFECDDDFSALTSAFSSN